MCHCALCCDGMKPCAGFLCMCCGFHVLGSCGCKGGACLLSWRTLTFWNVCLPARFRVRVCLLCVLRAPQREWVTFLSPQASVPSLFATREQYLYLLFPSLVRNPCACVCYFLWACPGFCLPVALPFVRPRLPCPGPGNPEHCPVCYFLCAPKSLSRSVILFLVVVFWKLPTLVAAGLLPERRRLTVLRFEESSFCECPSCDVSVFHPAYTFCSYLCRSGVINLGSLWASVRVVLLSLWSSD